MGIYHDTKAITISREEDPTCDWVHWENKKRIQEVLAEAPPCNGQKSGDPMLWR